MWFCAISKPKGNSKAGPLLIPPDDMKAGLQEYIEDLEEHDLPSKLTLKASSTPVLRLTQTRLV
jgi:hypothetical protein